MGQAADSLDVDREIVGNYMLNSVPEPHPDLLFYSAVAGETSGVCRIVGISDEFGLDGTGEAVRAAMQAFADGLQQSFGAPHLEDVFNGSGRPAASEWADAVRAEQRTYRLAWTASDASPLADNLTRVSLTARADAYDSTWFAVLFVFGNDASCVAEVDAKRNRLQ